MYCWAAEDDNALSNIRKEYGGCDWQCINGIVTNNTSDYPFVCTLCDKQLCSYGVVLQHINTKKHANKVYWHNKPPPPPQCTPQTINYNTSTPPPPPRPQQQPQTTNDTTTTPTPPPLHKHTQQGNNNDYNIYPSPWYNYNWHNHLYTESNEWPQWGDSYGFSTTPAPIPNVKEGAGRL